MSIIKKNTSNKQNSIASKIGKYCKYQRDKKSISLNEFARIVELDPSFLFRLENNHYRSIKFDVIEKIAQGFQMNVEEFLRKCRITSGEKDQLPEIEFYLKEKYQFPDEAIDDCKLFIELLQKKYLQEIDKNQKAHQKYWHK